MEKKTESKKEQKKNNDAIKNIEINSVNIKTEKGRSRRTTQNIFLDIVSRIADKDIMHSTVNYKCNIDVLSPSKIKLYSIECFATVTLSKMFFKKSTDKEILEVIYEEIQGQLKRYIGIHALNLDIVNKNSKQIFLNKQINIL